ncbi:hypothetical protein SHM7688_02254 [Shimia marina]|uniref:Uncharacterized protein n=1 Tax=Shimia marina TaxID=321267 RepID=A0A0P1ERB1_9RHOB|nr:hypothetical protein SHM7688_02254 [Shimia marina]
MTQLLQGQTLTISYAESLGSYAAAIVIVSGAALPG